MKNKAQLMVNLDIDVKDKLEQYSKDSLIPKSALINKLIKTFFEDLDKQKK